MKVRVYIDKRPGSNAIRIVGTVIRNGIKMKLRNGGWTVSQPTPKVRIYRFMGSW